MDQTKYKLTPEQKRIFEEVEYTSKNIFITGKPGVGKSVLINYIRENSSKTWTFTAPTGLAALNIDAYTLHSTFKLPVSVGIIDQTYNRFPIDPKTINRIKYGVRCLMIDEVSMVRADTFDYLDRLLRFCKEVNLPFGGIQVIIVGDFFQLPPIVVREEVPQLRQCGYTSPFVFSSRIFHSNFKIMELSKVLRQKGDNKFIELLNAARTGSITPEQIRALNKQVGQPDDLRIRLTAKNQEADNINFGHLRGIAGEEHRFYANVFGEWPALPVEQELRLKVGAQVMVKYNNADRPPSFKGEWMNGVVNGTIGIVKKIITEASMEGAYRDKEGEFIPTVTIELEDGEERTIFRRRWERKVKEQVDGEWDEVTKASYEQMPLALAWAISIHKSQGQSFERVHIDASSIFAPGQLYVALSRCRSMAGISLENEVSPRQFWCNRDVLEFFNNVELDTKFEKVTPKKRKIK